MINHKYRGRVHRQISSACNRPADRAGVQNVPAAVVNRPAGIKFEYLTCIGGLKVIMTDHAKQQASKRHGMKLEQMKDWFEYTADVTASIPVAYYNEEVFVYSIKHQRGMILAYRRDNRSDSRNVCLVVVTVYPYGSSKPMKPGTRSFVA